MQATFEGPCLGVGKWLPPRKVGANRSGQACSAEAGSAPPGSWDAPEQVGEQILRPDPCPGGLANDPLHSPLQELGTLWRAGPLAGILPVLTRQRQHGGGEGKS